MTTTSGHSVESVAQGVLERVFQRIMTSSHTFANLVCDVTGAARATTGEERDTIVRLLEDGLAELQARGTIMGDRRAAHRAWLLTPPNLTDRPAGASRLTRVDDRVPRAA
jgi:hypothetical protein